MAISLKHSFQSAKADGADTSLVRPSDWNAEHTLTQATNRLLGRTTAGTGATEEISVGSGLTFTSGSLSANVTSVAGRTGAVTLAVADVSGAAPTASPALTGTPTAPTAAADTNTTQIATTAYVVGQDYLKKSGGTMTGTLTLPSNGLTVGTNQLLVSGGNVGIGASPAYNLDVYDSTSAVSRVYGDSTTLSITSRASSDTLAPIQQFHKYRGTQASPTIVADGDVTGRIIFYGYDGAALRATAEIRSTVNGTPGSADMPGSLAFYTTADGAAASTARMLIDEAGLIGVGTTTPADTVGFGSIFDMRSSFGAGIYLRSSAAPTTNYTYVAHAASNSTAYFWNVGNGAIYVGTNNTERFNVSSTGLIALASGAGLSVSATGVTSPAAGNGNVFSGTYNPGANGTNTNVASVTYNTAQYMRVGNQVTVSGSVAVTVTTANTNTVLRMTIPVASNFGGASNAGGAGASASGTYGGGMAILGDATNDGVEMRFQAASTASLTWQYSFSYRVF